MHQSKTKTDKYLWALSLILILLTGACASSTEGPIASFQAPSVQWEDRLAELEFRASKPDSLPKDSDEVEEFISELGLLIGELSPFEEANYFSQLADLRWMAIALDALYREPVEPTDSLSEETPYGIAIQLRAIAEEKPRPIGSIIGNSVSVLEEKLLERANVLENRDIDGRLYQARQFLIGTKTGPIDLTTVDDGVFELLDYLSYYESTQSARQHEIGGVREQLEVTLAALEAEALDRPRRDYQGWALRQIWDFEEKFEQIKEGFSVLGLIREEDEYREIQDAVVAHLLPIDQALLDRPLVLRYQRGFDEAWGILDKQDERKAQTCVAIATAIIAKRTFYHLVDNDLSSDRFANNKQWREKQCDH